AGAMRKNNSAADVLVGLPRIDDEPHRDLDGLVELGDLVVDHQLDRFFERVALFAIDFFQCFFIFFPGHSSDPQSLTSMPMLRAVPETVLTAAARSAAVRSFSLVLAISSTCARVTLPTLFLLGIGEPFSIPAARRSRIEAGGLLVTNVNERSAYTVTITGMTRPCMFWVWALKALQNSMILTPRWPSAGPTGGEGFAAPAGICSLIDPTTFLATLKSFLVAQSRTPLARASAARLRRIDCCFVASGLLYLHKVQFDRSCTAEDRDQNAHLPLFGLDFLDGAVEVLERAVNDFDRLAHLEQHLGLGPQRPFFHLLLDLCDFGHWNFGRIGGVSDEAGNFRRVLDDVPGLVVEHHLHKDVA